MRLLIAMAAASICNLGAGAFTAAPARAGTGNLHLAPGADDTAIAAVRQAAWQLKSVTIDSSQTFAIVDRGRPVATLVAGGGQAPGAVYRGCFVALVQDGRTMVVPTIGNGAWEAETCGGAMATGLITAGDIAIIGIVYDAASPNTRVREPVLLRWNRKDHTLSIDEALSQRSSIKGATTIAAMRRLLL